MFCGKIGKNLKFFTLSFWQTRPHQFVAMIDQFQKQCVRNIAVGRHGIPVLLVHVVSAGYAAVMLSQLYGSFRIALEVGPVKRFQITQCKQLPPHLENQGAIIEG